MSIQVPHRLGTVLHKKYLCSMYRILGAVKLVLQSCLVCAPESCGVLSKGMVCKCACPGCTYTAFICVLTASILKKKIEMWQSKYNLPWGRELHKSNIWFYLFYFCYPESDSSEILFLYLNKDGIPWLFPSYIWIEVTTPMFTPNQYMQLELSPRFATIQKFSPLWQQSTIYFVRLVTAKLGLLA